MLLLLLPCTVIAVALTQARKELAKSVSFSDKHQDSAKAAAADAAPAQAGATAAVTLGSAYEKVSTTHLDLCYHTTFCAT